MGRRKQIQEDISDYTTKSPARDPEEWENRMINLSMEAAERRIRDGTASSAEIVHFLKLGSSRERLEQEEKRKEIELKRAKTDALESAQRIEALYSDAVNAMRKYAGQGRSNEEDQDY